ncbi:maleylpyruvate isomerase N-terminal domain-containing protein [Amycolatopsis panacis]|uniref:Uncharacterized protein n=1 Tax=Amycolatopsis panacis TaxID=2340917 RepID=A0A419I2M4_9PSEU|nr:maleylpyruvate isomerase N-terminal domain-containing protein [Amycolatopsis panacis]RJQ84210.1 hypothetical protein D5S19_17945 [Amycolatopsis panacis]
MDCQEFATCLEMMVEAGEREWQSQTPCDRWEIRDMAGHLLDAAYCYLGYFKQGEGSATRSGPAAWSRTFRHLTAVPTNEREDGRWLRY